MDLSQLGLNLPSGGNTNLTIPGLDGLQNVLSIISIASIVISVVFIVLYLITVIRRWRVDRAIMETQKDVHAIRLMLETDKIHRPATLVAAETQQPNLEPLPADDQAIVD